MQNGRTQQNNGSMGFSNRKGQKLPTCLTLKNSEHRGWLVQCTEFYLAWKLCSSDSLLRTGYLLYIFWTQGLNGTMYWVLPGVEVELLSQALEDRLPIYSEHRAWLLLSFTWRGSCAPQSASPGAWYTPAFPHLSVDLPETRPSSLHRLQWHKI